MTVVQSRAEIVEPAAIGDRSVSRLSPAAGIVVSAATVVVIVMLAVLPLLSPVFIHPALDAAGAAELLGLDPATTRDVSDRAVADLLSPGGAFALTMPGGEPFFDESERAHLRDARALLGLALASGIAGGAVILVALMRHRGPSRAAVWRVVGRGGALAVVGTILLGAIGLIAFGALFSLFHEVFFPGGNWSFDPATQRLVRLYPLGFWQAAAMALASIVVVLGGLTWWLARRRAMGLVAMSAR